MRIQKQNVVAGLLVTVGMAMPAMASNISTIEAQPSGTAVTLDGNAVVTAIGSVSGAALDGYTYTNTVFTVTDGTGSLEVFGKIPTGSTYQPSVGDIVGVSGKYSPFNAIPELGTLTALTQVSSGNPVPAPQVVSTSDLDNAANLTDSNFLGYYLSLTNVEFSPSSASPLTTFPVHANGTYTVTDLSGNNPLTLFQQASSYSAAGLLGGTAIPSGPVDITGIVDDFSGTPEFIPFSVTPVSAVPEPTSIGLIAVGAVALVKRRRRSN